MFSLNRATKWWSQLVIRVNENRHPAGRGLAKDAGDIASIAFSRNTVHSCTNINVTATCCGGSSTRAHSCIAVAAGVAIERPIAIGRIAGTLDVAKERMKTTGCVRGAIHIVLERQTADSGVVGAGNVACERIFTDSGIVVGIVVKGAPLHRPRC